MERERVKISLNNWNDEKKKRKKKKGHSIEWTIEKLNVKRVKWLLPLCNTERRRGYLVETASETETRNYESRGTRKSNPCNLKRNSLDCNRLECIHRKDIVSVLRYRM